MYTLVGGLRAVMVTETVQAVLLLAASVVMLVAIGLITVVTPFVTSLFIQAAHKQAGDEHRDRCIGEVASWRR